MNILLGHERVESSGSPRPPPSSACPSRSRLGGVLRQVRRRPAGSRRGAPVGLLIDACHALAAERGASALVAGVNAGRDRAWRVLAGRGFRRDRQGVTKHRPNEPGYSTSGSFVIDDWR